MLDKHKAYYTIIDTVGYLEYEHTIAENDKNLKNQNQNRNRNQNVNQKKSQSDSAKDKQKNASKVK